MAFHSGNKKEIVMSGLVFYLDPLDSISHPSGTTVKAYQPIKSTDVISGTMTNTPSHNSSGYYEYDDVDYTTWTNVVDLPVGSEARTMEHWIRPHSLTNYPQGINYGSLSGGQWSALYFYQSKIYFAFYSNDIQGTTTLSTNTWYHIAMTYEGGTGARKLYLNGAVDQTQNSITAANTASTTTVRIAARVDDDTNSRFDGDIGCSRIYNRALSAAEILKNFTKERSRFGV